MIAEIEAKNLHFISNVKDRTFPRGMSIEIVNTEWYEKSYSLFKEIDLEHVMTYFYRTNDENVAFIYNSEKTGQGLNFAIDTDQDFANARKIIHTMERNHTQYGYQEVIQLFEKIKENE